MMMQASDLPSPDDFPIPHILHCGRLWAVPLQGEVSASVVVVAEVPSQDTLQVLLIEHDDVIQALPPDAADQLFRIRILPGALGGDHHLPDPRAMDTVLETTAIDATSILQQVAGHLTQGKASTICWAIHSAVGCSVTLK